MKSIPLPPEINSENTLLKFLNSFSCVGCTFLNITEEPAEKWKCTHEFAFKQYKNYTTGFETDKEWIRQNDIELEKNNDKSLPLPRQDVNFYFCCPKFNQKTL